MECNQTIIITGANGMIGTRLVYDTIFSGFNVIAIDCEINEEKNLTVKAIKNERINFLKNNIKEEKLKWCVCDFSKKNAFEKILKYIAENKVDVVGIFHLAARANISYSVKNPNEVFYNNYNCTLNSLELARKINCSIIFASSSSVYGNSINKKQSENDILSALNPYASSKVIDEQLVYSYCKSFGLRAIGFRFFTVYGEYNRPDMFVYSVFNKIYKNESISLYNNGNIFRDFTSSRDVSEIVLKTFDKLRCERESFFEIFNLGQGKPSTVLEIVKEIEKIVKKDALLVLENNKPSFDSNGTHANNEKLDIYLGKHNYLSKEIALSYVEKWFMEHYKKLNITN